LAKDVIITPADGDVQFKNASSVDAGRIEQTGDDIAITNAVGDVLIGDGSSDLYIGDGVASVDLVFDVNGSVRGESGVTLTLGASGSTTAIAGLSSSSETSAVMRNTTTGALTYRTLGSNAFNSTSYLPLTGGTLTDDVTVGSFGNNNAEFSLGQTIANKVFSYGVEFQTKNTDIQLVLGRNNGTAVQGTGGIGASATNAFHIYDTTSVTKLFEVAQTSGDTTIAGDVDVSGGTVTIQSTGTATLILDGDSNDVDDTGQTDSIIDMRHDGGTYGMRLSARNYSGKSAFRIQENRNGTYSERFYIDEDGLIGLGTTDPNVDLHIYKSGSTYLKLQRTTVGSEGQLMLGATNSDNRIYSHGVNTSTGKDLVINFGGNDTHAFNSNGSVGLGTITPNSNARLNVMGNATFGKPGNGQNTSGRFISIEGNTDSAGEGSGRIFFSEHNSSTASMSKFGMSIGYRGGGTTITGADGNDWTGLSLIDNGEWGMWGHDNSAQGSLIMHGDRAGTFTNMSTRLGINGDPATDYKLDVNGAGRFYRDLVVGGITTSSSTINYENVLRVKGKNNYSDGTTWYGDYGQILLDANTNMTGSARKFLITNALGNNKFAIVRSVDAGTDPIVNSVGGGSTPSSGVADFVIDYTGKIGIGKTTPLAKMEINGGLLVGGTTFSKNTNSYATGNISLDNGSNDSGGIHFYYANNTNYGIDVASSEMRFVHNLDESGGSVKMSLNTSGDLDISGDLYTSGGIVQSDGVDLQLIRNISYDKIVIKDTQIDFDLDQATRFKITNDGTTHFRFGGANYEEVTFSHTASYGNGTMQIQPVTIPGSGTANFYTHFAQNSGVGTTTHNVVIDHDLYVGDQIIHSGDTNTYMQFHAEDQWRVVTGGNERIQVANGGIVINDGSNDYDLRVESNGNANMLKVDGGNDAVGIGVNPNSANALHVYGAVSDAPLRVQSGDTHTGITFQDPNGTNHLFYYGSQNHFYLNGSGVTFGVGVNSITTTNLSLDVENKVRASGIMFGTDTADANTLDDYEEGSWTPIYASTGSSIDSVTYDTDVRFGRYIKIGNVVHLWGRIRTDGLIWFTNSGSVYIDGMPFPATQALSNGTLTFAGCVGYANNFSGEEPQKIGMSGGSTDRLYLYYNSSSTANSANVNVADLGGSSGSGTNANDVMFQVTYRTD